MLLRVFTRTSNSCPEPHNPSFQGALSFDDWVLIKDRLITLKLSNSDSSTQIQSCPRRARLSTPNSLVNILVDNSQIIRNTLDNQLAITKIEVLIKRTAFVTLALMVFILGWIVILPKLQVSDPYVESVLSLQGNYSQGQEIFFYNCAGCHAWHLSTQVGPSLRDVSLRKSEVGIIQQVISGNTPPMPKFQPSAKEMADLLSYLETL